MGWKKGRKWCNIYERWRCRWNLKKQGRRSTDGSKGRWRGGCFNRIRFKTRDKNINANDARQRILGKVGCIHLEKFWRVNERRRWRIISGWKWSGNSMATQARGVLVILSPWNGICRLNRWDQTSSAPISHDESSDGCDPPQSGFFDFGFDKKKKGCFFLFSPLSVGELSGWWELKRREKNGSYWDAVVLVICYK